MRQLRLERAKLDEGSGTVESTGASEAEAGGRIRTWSAGPPSDQGEQTRRSGGARATADGSGGARGAADGMPTLRETLLSYYSQRAPEDLEEVDTVMLRVADYAAAAEGDEGSGRDQRQALERRNQEVPDPAPSTSHQRKTPVFPPVIEPRVPAVP
jgi:hypothetical protein